MSKISFPTPISYNEALSHIYKNIKCLESEEIDLNNSFFRILSEDIVSNMSIPQKPISAMDGYALPDLGNNQSGYSLESDKTTHAQRILTGHAVPDWAKCVAAEEVCYFRDSKLYTDKSFEEGTNIRPSGEDVKEGTTVARKGKIIDASLAGRIASIGVSKVKVIRKPRVAIITSGNELVKDSSENYDENQRFECDSFILKGLIISAGGEPVLFDHLPDNHELIKQTFVKAKSCDLIITCGGASNSEADHIRPALKELGAEFKYERVHIKPGRPTAFAKLGHVPVFVLPGNPVAVYVTFVALANEGLNILLGNNSDLNKSITPNVIADENIPSDSKRTLFNRVRLKQKGDVWVAKLYSESGSGLIRSLTESNAIALIPPGEDIQKGDNLKIFKLI